MRICLYTETALPKIGGQELVVDALARQYQNLGHEVTVLAPQPRPPWEVNDLALPYPVVRHWRFVSTRRLVAPYRYWLRALGRRFPFDVLHCHSVYPCGYLAALCRNSWNVPTAITSHGEFRLLHKPGLRERYVQAVRGADALIAISRFTAEGYRQLAPETERIVALPNGVHLDAFAARHDRPLGLDADIAEGRYVLFLGRLSRRKGVDVLLHALARLGDAWRDVPLVVAGEGDQRGALEQLAGELGLSKRVRFVGSVGGSGKCWLLQNARCLVAPSRLSEAFPLVVLEGFAAGCPVVGTRVAGLEEHITPEQTGLLVAPESPTELAAALRRLLSEVELARAMGREAQKRAAGYDWEQVAWRHVELFERLRGGGSVGNAA